MRRSTWPASGWPRSVRGCSCCWASPTTTPTWRRGGWRTRSAACGGSRANRAPPRGVCAEEEGRMKEPLGDREVLCVSQFTLYGDARRGNRPSYVEAAPGPQAEPLYDRFCERLGAKKGGFGAC